MGGFRCVFAIALLLASGGSAAAQRHSPPPPTPPPQVTPPSSLPSAPAALTVPMPLGPPPGTVDLYARPDQFHSIPSTPSLFVPGPVYVPGFGPGPYPPGTFPSGYVAGPDAQYMMVPPPVPSVIPRVARGSLRFETEPGSAQVFVDGFYVGIVDDFGMRGRPLEIAAGSHHIELRAPDYAPLSFEINIVPNQLSRYRGDLQLMNPAAAPPAARNAPAKKYYVIPNCYAGDKPPVRALPGGCAVGQMRVIENK